MSLRPVLHRGIEIAIILAVLLAFVISEARAEEYCYDSYPSPVTPQFKSELIVVRIVYLDVGRGEEARASWAYDVETGITVCRIEVRIPDDVIGDPDMDSIGHELLHCMIGAFH